MYATEPFSNDLSELQIWRIIQGAEVFASAVLLSPYGGKGDQNCLLLKGSRLRGSETRSCPIPAFTKRRVLEANRVAERQGKTLVLKGDHVVRTPWLGACVSLGRSVNGWDFWRLDGWGPSLNEVWYDRDFEVKLYDLSLQPNTKPGEVITSGRSATLPWKTRDLIKTSELNVYRQHIPQGNDFQGQRITGHSLFECLEGRVTWAASGQVKELACGQMVYFNGKEQPTLHAVENTLLLVTTFRTSES